MLQRVGQRQGGTFVDGLLGQTQRDGAVGGDCFRQFVSRVVQLRGGYDTIGHAVGQRGRGVVHLRAEDPAFGPRRTSQPRQPLRAPGAGDDGQSGLAQTDLGVVGQDAHVAAESEFATTARRGAAHGRNRRERQIREGVAHPGQPRNERLDLVLGHRAPLLEIGAGTKVLARAPDDQAPHGGIVLQLLQRIFHVPDELPPQCVHGRAIECHRRNPVRGFQPHRAHSSPPGAVAPCEPTAGAS